MGHTKYIWNLIKKMIFAVKIFFSTDYITSLILTFGEMKGVIGDSVLHIFINGDFSLVISILSSVLPQTKNERYFLHS